MESCDMCGTKIENGKCSCGEWLENQKTNCILKSIEYFHDMKRFTITGDAPHLGCAVVFFRGDYKDAKKVEKFIHEMKARPYYKE